MSVHYKFKSALEYDTVTFDGLHISVKDLKKAILQQKKIGKTIDFDLQITNAQTKETYTNDDALISKNASLIVARVPLTQQQRKQWENNKQASTHRLNDGAEQSSLSQVDISSLDLSEEDKIKTMMSQSTSDYDPSNYVKVRGSNQVGTVPASYICFKCHQRGHWIKDCPYDGSNVATETIKKSTGIPRSFMIEVEGPQVPGARMTPSGVYAVPAIDHEVYKGKKIEKPPFLADKPAKATIIPEDLICGICKDLLQDAVMVPCCGISFCDECIRNYLVDSEESECPDCNEKEVSPDTLIPNRFLRNNVNTFKNETGYIKVKTQIIQQRPPTPPRPSLPDFVPPPGYQNEKPSDANESQPKPVSEGSPVTAVPIAAENKEVQDNTKTEEAKGEDNSIDGKDKKVKKSDIEVDDVSSVSSNTSEEPPPPVENRRADETVKDPSQCPSYAIPSLFSGLHPVTLPPPGSERYPPPRPADTFLGSHSDSGEERSSTPTVDEVMEIPPLRAPYDPYRPPNYGVPYYDQHYSVPPSFSMPYDPSGMYDRPFRGYSRGRAYRGRYAMRQPPPPGSRPITPPRNEEEAYLAFQRMLKEKEERDKRKSEKLKLSRRTTSRSRSRSAGRSRRSFSGVRSRSRTRSRTPARRTRSRSKKRSHTRSRSFVISRSRSRSYSRSPLHERNYSPKKYSPNRSPLRYERFDGNYGPWNQDQRDYRRGAYRTRGRKRFYNKSPPRGPDHPPYNRYRDENFMTSPQRSPSRYYDQRVSPKCNDYSRDSRDRDFRSGERETESSFRDRNLRRRSHSNSLIRNHFEEKERDRDRDRGRDRDRERDRERDRDRDRERERDRDRDRERDRERERERDRDRERERDRDRDKNRDSDRDRERNRDRDGDRDNAYRHRSRSRRSGSRRFTPIKKTSEDRTERSKEKSPDLRPKEQDRDKDVRNRSRERRSSYDFTKDKRKLSRERNRSRDYDKDRRHGRSRDRSRSRDKRKRSTSRDKRRRSISLNRKRRSPSRQRSISRNIDEKRRSHSIGNRSSRSRHRIRSESIGKDRKRSLSRQIQEVVKKSLTPEKKVELSRIPSPKVPDKEDDDKKDKKKEKEKKKKKKEKETDEERAARKKRKKEKKEEKKRKQELKVVPEIKSKAPDATSEQNEEKEICPTEEVRSDPGPNFMSTFTAVEDSEAKITSTVEDDTHNKMSPSELDSADIGVGDENVELELHTSYDSLLEESGEKDKKGILAQLPEISKWELEDNQVVESNPKQILTDNIKKSPDYPVKVTREVIKRAENAIFKRAVNAIREPSKIMSDKEERKDRKPLVTQEKDRTLKDARLEQDVDKSKRVFVPREKEKIQRNTLEFNKPKTEVKRTINSLQITIPISSEGDNGEEGKGKTTKRLLSAKDDNQKSPPAGRISVKERLGSKVEKSNRNASPPVPHNIEKRGRNVDEDILSESKSLPRKDHQLRSTLSSTIESIDAKRSTIDEAHFVPNYDESSDEEENTKSRHGTEKDMKTCSNGNESKKRSRSSSDSMSEESTKKHKKKKSKSKKKKQKRPKKHQTESSDSSDSEREKKKHKKSKKKKKSKH